MDSDEYVAYCDDEGLIGFGSGKPPHGHHLLISGNEEDMALVRELAHRDGNSFWVPGVRDGQGLARKLRAFRDALYCDDGFTLYSESENAQYPSKEG